MQAVVHDHSARRIGLSKVSLAKGTGWGLFGGLVATLVMDLILMVSLMTAGLPALSCYSIVGDSVATLFSPGVVGTAGSIPLGMAAHYLIGPLMGGLFGAVAAMRIAAAKSLAVAKGNVLRVDSWKKAVVLAVLYAEIFSQPMLAIVPILLRMTASETLQWFGGSLVMHMIWGCVLGALWSRGVGLPVEGTSFEP